VLNERRQNYENRPYGMAPMAILEALFPPDHPYHWLTIGSADDLQAASLDDVRTFFQRFYHPANASLALAGDVSADEVLPLVDAYFGDIEPGPVVPAVAPARVVPVEARLVLEDSVELPRLYLTWHSPAIFADGDADLDLAADVLGEGKSSRLYKNLVYENRVATDVAAVQQSRELSGFFQVISTAAPGHSLAELEERITRELDLMAASGPSDAELGRSHAQAEANFVYRVQTVGGFGGKSDQLNQYKMFVGDPGYFDRDLERYRTATPTSVGAACRRYVAGQPRVAVSIVPKGRLDLALPGSTKVVCS